MEDLRRTIRSLQDELEKFMVVEPGQEVSEEITITVNGKTFELYNDAAFVDGLHRALQDFVENL